MPHSTQETFPAGNDIGNIVKMVRCIFFSQNGLILIPASITWDRSAITSQAQMVKCPRETQPRSQEMANGEESRQSFLNSDDH